MSPLSELVLDLMGGPDAVKLGRIAEAALTRPAKPAAPSKAEPAKPGPEPEIIETTGSEVL